MIDSTPKRVVILGGGFGGVYTAMALEKLRRGQDDFEIILVNRENYFVYQPLLPEIISGSIGIFDTVSPLRRLLRKTEIQVREVESIDLAGRVVNTAPGFKPVPHPIPYDHLVFSLGTVTDFRGMTGLPQHALPFKYLGDAIHLRNHVIHVLEEASIEKDPALKQALLTFVIVGGGFSGVECAAELNDLIRRVAKSYRGIDPKQIRIVLLEIMDHILLGMEDRLRLLAEKVLVDKGIDLKLKTGLQAATGDEVILTDGSRIATKTLVSTVPASPNPIIDALDLPKERGRIKVDPHLQVEGSDHLWAVGDCAVIPDPAGPAPDGKPRFCPPTAQYAVREGELVAQNIVASIRSGTKEPFTFRGLGKMGGLGHHSAVAEVMGMSLSGLPAWLLWRAVYLMKLPGWDRQLKTGLSWMGNMFFPPELVQLKIEHGQGVMQEHYEPGQAVFHQNELGDRLYIILKGRCEVVRSVDGTEQKLAELGPGEYFGEMALLNETTRAATVRVLEAMDVLSVPRPEFNALVSHLPALKQSFEAVAEERQR